MKKITLLISSFTLYFMTNAQDFNWAKSFGASSSDYGNSICTDNSGNIYSTGYFNGTVDFDPGVGTANLVSNGSSDVYIQKMDASGNYVWAKSFGSNMADQGECIAIDGSGNIYTTGFFRGLTDFDPDTSSYYYNAVGGWDVFIQKLDAAGNFVWAIPFGGTGNDLARSITVDAQGYIYTIGHFEGTVDFNPDTGTSNMHTLISNGADDIFIQKLDAAGNFVWAKSFGGTGYDIGYSITVDALGNVYTTGYFQGTADLDPGTGTHNLTSNGVSEVFVQKLNAAGNFVWAKSFGGNVNDAGECIITDVVGNIYTTGSFNGTGDFDSGSGTNNLTSNGSSDIFIHKLDTAGNFVWAKSFGGTGYDQGYSIKTDASNNVYITGYFQNTVDFNPGTGVDTLMSNGGSDVFIQKLDAAGNYVWSKSFGGQFNDVGKSMFISNLGEVYTTGVFQGTCDFDPEAGTTNLISNGQQDVFVHKMSQQIANINKLNNEKTFSVYPNPTTNTLNIASQSTFSKINILDVNGKLIKSKNSNKTTINVADLISGFYIVVLLDENNQAIARQKFIKQ